MAALVLGLVAASASASGGSGSPSATNVSSSATDSLAPVLAADGPDVHVAWIESEATTDGLRATIVTARSLDAGETFESPVVVAALGGYASGLRIAAANGRVHLVWLATAYTTGAPSAVDAARSVDRGATFEPVRSINDGVAPGIPWLDIVGDEVAIAWAARGDVWLVTSDDGSATRTEPKSIAEAATAVDGSVRVALSACRVVVAWIASRGPTAAVVVRSTARKGDGTSTPTELTPPAARALELSLDADANSAVVVWTDAAASRVDGARSADGGVTFAPFALATPTSSIAMPSVALDERGASIVWLDAHATLWLRREGRDVGQPIVVERLGRHARSPSLSARDGITCVAWGTGSGKGAIVSRCRAASGSLGPRLRVTRRTSKAAAPVPLVMETAAIVAWSQPVEGPHDVFVAMLPKLATRDE